MFQTDAGRTACTRPLQCSSVALGHRRAKAPTKGLSTLNSMAFGLAVYASQCGLLQHHARLASSCWSGSTGRAFHPQGSDERFQSCNLHLIPLSQACLAQSMQPLSRGVSKRRGVKGHLAPLPLDSAPHVRWRGAAVSNGRDYPIAVATDSATGHCSIRTTTESPSRSQLESSRPSWLKTTTSYFDDAGIQRTKSCSPSLNIT